MASTFTDNDDHYNFIGDYFLSEVSLSSYAGNIKDIKLSMIELSIFESIWDSVVSGNIVLADSLNLPVHTPIVGSEKISFTLDTRGLNFPIRFDGDVFSIDQRHFVSNNDRQQGYILNFVSPEQWTNSTTNISLAIPNTTISNAVKIISDRYLPGTSFFIEPTAGTTSLIIPNWSPFTSISWLAGRAVPANKNGASYVFYKTTDRFNFVSLESLYEIEEENIIASFVYQPANIGKTIKDITTDFFAIQKLEILSTFDTLSSFMNGMYSSSLDSYDPTYKRFNTITHSYADEWDRHVHMEKNFILSGQGKTALTSVYNNIRTASPNAIKFNYPQHSLAFDNIPTNGSEKYFLPRISQLAQLENIKLKIVVPGNSAIHVGNIVNVYVPSAEQNKGDEGTIILDKYLSGRYLIASLRHKVTRASFFTVLELVKDSVSSPLPLPYDENKEIT